MPQIVHVIANENARYKRNELEYTVLLPRHVINIKRNLKETSTQMYTPF